MLYLLCSGALIADPQRRESKAGTEFATATLRIGDGDEANFVSIAAFGEHAARLLDHRRGEPLSVSGRAKLNSWTARDGSEKHGLAVTVGEIASLKPRPRSIKRRSVYSPPPNRSVPDLADDSVDELFRELAP